MNDPEPARTWWHKARPYTLAELIADGVVHGIGLLVALVAGGALIVLAAMNSVTGDMPALVLYVASFVVLLSVSLTFNLWPHTGLRRLWARLDQAAIFLFIAGTYTPFLALMAGAPGADWLAVAVWGTALVGIALKLIVPHRFGRLAIVLYLAIGWSGVITFQTLAVTLPASTLTLLIAGGLTYSAGIVFHLWERLKFQNVVWHVFVVAGASLHLMAIYSCTVLVA
jgi:hemolysin III